MAQPLEETSVQRLSTLSPASRWNEARTLSDLAECTGVWLRGTLPGRTPLPSLGRTLRALAECADAGFLVGAAHPGRPDQVVDGRIHRHRAAVHGHLGDDRLLHRLA